MRSVLRVLSGSEQEVVAPTAHWLEFAVAQLVHVRPSLQVGVGVGVGVGVRVGTQVDVRLGTQVDVGVGM